MFVHTFRFLLLITAMLLPPALLAQGQDTVILVNGDRLTGTITRLEEGKLALDSDLLGAVRVSWSNVRAVESDSSFSVLMEDGVRHDGTLSREGDEVSIVSDSGDEVAVASPSIMRIVPGTSGGGAGRLLAALDGAMDIGYSLARGNQNQMQSSLGARAEAAVRGYTFSGRLNSLFARQDGARSQSRHALNARVEHIVNARLFSYGLAGLERNERRRLDLRTRLGGGLGWRLRKSRTTEVALLGGLAFLHENSRQAANRVTGEGFVGIEWDTALAGGIELSTQFTLHPDARDAGNVRAELDSTLRVPITGRFTYSLSLFDRFHTRPVEGVERNDYGLVSGVGVSF